MTLGARQQDFLLGTIVTAAATPLPTGHLALWHLPRVATVLPAALLTSMEGTPPPLSHVTMCRGKAGIQWLRVRMRKNLVSKLGLSTVVARDRKGSLSMDGSYFCKSGVGWGEVGGGEVALPPGTFGGLPSAQAPVPRALRTSHLKIRIVCWPVNPQPHTAFH